MGMKKVAVCLTGAALLALALPVLVSALATEKTTESTARAGQEQTAEETDQPDQTEEPLATGAAETADPAPADAQNEETPKNPGSAAPRSAIALSLNGRDVTGVTANFTWIDRLSAPPAAQLKATAPDGRSLSPGFKSSDETVVTVDASGIVTAVGYGVATITATIGGQSASCEIAVGQTAQRVIIISEDFVSPGRSIRLRAFDQDGNRISALWRSSSDKLASVSPDGLLTASRAAAGHTVDVTALAGEDSQVFAVKTIQID